MNQESKVALIAAVIGVTGGILGTFIGVTMTMHATQAEARRAERLQAYRTLSKAIDWDKPGITDAGKQKIYDAAIEVELVGSDRAQKAAAAIYDRISRMTGNETTWPVGFDKDREEFSEAARSGL